MSDSSGLFATTVRKVDGPKYSVADAGTDVVMELVTDAETGSEATSRFGNHEWKSSLDGPSRIPEPQRIPLCTDFVINTHGPMFICERRRNHRIVVADTIRSIVTTSK